LLFLRTGDQRLLTEEGRISIEEDGVISQDRIMEGLMVDEER